MKKCGVNINKCTNANYSLFDKADDYYIPQIEPAERVESEVKKISNEHLNLPQWNWCGICCLAMILDGQKIKRETILKMYKEAFLFGVYKSKNIKIIGAYHKQLADYIYKKYSLKAKAIKRISAADIALCIYSDYYFIASVTSEIARYPQEPMRKSGHLILVFGVKDNKLIFHNSTGYYSNCSQRSVEIPINEFENYFSGNGIIVKSN